MQRRRFMVFDGSLEEYGAFQKKGVREFQSRILAVWEVAAGRPGEPDWIERLARAGEADVRSRYPRHDRYTSHAFFVKRLSLWEDIASHWERRNAFSAALRTGSPAPPATTWVIVSFFAPERFRECPSEAVLTIDAVNTLTPLR